MAKYLLAAIAGCLVSLYANAQLAHTRWTGEVNSATPLTVLWDFKTDTLNVFALPDTVLIESMFYKVADHVLFVKKIVGSSPCDTALQGRYTIGQKDDQITFVLLDDPCGARAAMINKETYTQTKASAKTGTPSPRSL